jgi:hypothetical protein
MTETDYPGPIDFVLIEFPGTAVGNKMAEELFELVDRGIVRLYDLLVIRKASDGSYTALDLGEAPVEQVGGLVSFAGATSGLLTDDDIAQAADAMEPGTIGALIVYENAWAAGFVEAAHREGGQLIASQRISAQDLIDALDAADAAD